MWILAISIYYIQNEKCEIFKTQEFTSTYTDSQKDDLIMCRVASENSTVSSHKQEE